MRASLWPDDTKLNRASGLSTANHRAIPGSLPRWRARTGSDTIRSTTPTSSMARKAKMADTNEVPDTDAPAWLTDTNSGPYGEAVPRHTDAIEDSRSPRASAEGATWYGLSPAAASRPWAI